MKDVALLAGVSAMTVSRTLAGGRSVRPEVQERVLNAVAMLGYHRNENARSIRPGQPSGLIGVAITNIGNPYYGALALGIEDVVTEHGCRMILGTTGEDPSREEQLVTDFVGRQIDGIILVPTTGDGRYPQLQQRRDIPTVFASRMSRGLSADAVLVDDVGGSLRATGNLLKAGHRRVGYLGNSPSTFTGRRRLQGFRAAHRDLGVPLDTGLIHLGQQDTEAAEAAASTLINEQSVTAIFCANNRNAVGALQAIGKLLRSGQAGEPLPSIVSFDDFELSDLMPVELTIIDHDARQLGREAAKMLFERLEAEYQGPPRTLEMPVTIRNP